MTHTSGLRHAASQCANSREETNGHLPQGSQSKHLQATIPKTVGRPTRPYSFNPAFANEPSHGLRGCEDSCSEKVLLCEESAPTPRDCCSCSCFFLADCVSESVDAHVTVSTVALRELVLPGGRRPDQPSSSALASLRPIMVVGGHALVPPTC